MTSTSEALERIWLWATCALGFIISFGRSVFIMSFALVQTSTRGEQPCLVGVGHYRLTYFEDDYDVRYVVARWVPSACVPCGG